MNCEKYELNIAALALGERDALSETALAETEAHIRECADCRKVYEQTRRLASHLQPDAESTRIVATPSGPTHIMTAVSRDISRRRIRLLTKIAAAILIGVGLTGLIAVGHRVLRRPPVEQPVVQNTDPIPSVPVPVVPAPAPAPVPALEVVPAPVEPKLPTLEEAFLASENQKDAFKVLQDAFDAVKADKEAHADDYPLIITLCAQLKGKWPITNQATNSIKLASRCWTELGETQKAREVFIAYADYKGELEQREELRRGKTPEEAAATAMEIASRKILSEAESLFAHKDYVQSLSYCDVLITRYPTHERGLMALRLIGEYSIQHRQYDEAIRVFNQVIELNPDSRAAGMARVAMASALANRNRWEDASEVWMECAQRAKTRREQANYVYSAAQMLAFGGEDHKVAAEALFERVIKEYPDQSQWVASARRSIDKIHLEPFRGELRDVENPVDVLKK